MFAEVVLVQKVLVDRMVVPFQKEGVVRHHCHLFQDDRMFDRILCVLAPGEGAVAFDEDRRNRQGVGTVDRLDDHLAGVQLIVVFSLFPVQRPGAWNRAVKRIGMGGSEGGDSFPALGEDRGPP